MLPERRRRRSNRARRIGQLHRHAQDSNLAERGVIDRLHHVASVQVGILEHFTDVTNGSAGHPFGGERGQPFGPGPGFQPLRQNRLESSVVLDRDRGCS